MKNLKITASSLIILLFFCNISIPSTAQKKPESEKLTYVPVYSSIYHGNRDRVINLAVTLSIRNVDSISSISVYSIDYYNNSGTLIRNYLNSEKILKPYETMNIIVKESDTQGGSTAGFVVKWGSDKNINDLFMEAVMIGTYPQGISFTSRGVNIKR